MALNFTAIDFETANEQRGSVCAVGITTVRDSQIIETTSWYVQPPTGERFTNTYIHGITPAHCASGSTWADSLAAIAEYAEDGPLVAYNSPFDKGVYSAACRLSEIDVIDYVWRDARVAAKTHMVLDSYKLVEVSAHLGLPDFAHHDAAEDAEACARVVLTLAERHAVGVLDELWPVRASSQRSYYRRLPLPSANVEADPAHPLYGVSVTFTGELEGYERDDARAAVAALGAIVTSGPTKRTDVVVVGGFDPATFRSGATVSNKIQKALDLRAAGQQIEFISELDLVALLAYEPDR